MNFQEFQKKAEEIVHQILEQMYKEAEPGLNYREQLQKEERDGHPVYKLHYLPLKQQRVIVQRKLKQINLSNGKAKKIVKSQVHNGASPSTSLKQVNRCRKEEGLEPVEDRWEN